MTKKYIIKKKIVDQERIASITVYMTDARHQHDEILKEKHTTHILMYMCIYSELDRKLKKCKNINELIQSELDIWHECYEVVIMKLKTSYAAIRVNHMVRIVEDFIKQTILEKYD